MAAIRLSFTLVLVRVCRKSRNISRELGTLVLNSIFGMLMDGGRVSPPALPPECHFMSAFDPNKSQELELGKICAVSEVGAGSLLKICLHLEV